jgi:Fe-S-cluster-containing hydrogenase component 2/CRP-like cAMP-binding protein
VAPEKRKRGWLEWLIGPPRPAARAARTIPIDAPTGVDYRVMKARLFEGDLFGEISCMYGTPRSATVVADRPLYVLEMLRNVLDEITGDAQFQARMDRVYTERVLEGHLAGLSLFLNLKEEDLQVFRRRVELVRLRDGQVICDKGGPSDCVYIVRRGLVKVLLNEWPLLAGADVRDWKALVKGLSAGPGQVIASGLPEATRALLAQPALAEPDQAVLLAGLNTLLKDRNLTKPAELQKLTQDRELLGRFPDLPKAPDDRSDQDWRLLNRLVLEAVCLYQCPAGGGPTALRPGHRRAGCEQVLAYRGQGEYIGEIGVLLDQPRSATCVAYVHPRPEGPGSDPVGERWRRSGGRVELVKIPAEVFREVRQKYPAIDAEVREIAQKRVEHTAQRSRQPAWTGEVPVRESEPFEKLGLVQGQKLMLIDLARCTRCDECVQACVANHSDGRSRLFLDGPRFGPYLVPATCRSCLDPVCMIGCPVGSIRRGDNKEMVIEDWCIGCELCAKSCPYGSIQMHDLGLLPEGAHGWRFRAAAGLDGDEWTRPGYRDGDWTPGRAPFVFDRDMRAALGLGEKDPPGEVCFRRAFQLAESPTRPEAKYKLWLESKPAGQTARVWLNGKEVPAEKMPFSRGERTFEMAGEDRDFLVKGRNVLAVQLVPAAGSLETLLEAAVDEVRPSGAVITLRAVVCDQCSSLPGQVPACVHACPHEAAMRVDARAHFPGR